MKLAKTLTAWTLAITFAISVSGCDDASTTNDLASARQSLEEGDYDTAIVILKNSVRDDPTAAEPRWLLGKAHLNKNDAPSAEKELVIARRLGWSDNDVLPALAEALLAQRKNKEALALEVLDLQPLAAGKVYAFQAVAAASLGRVEEAATLISIASEQAPESSDILLAKARIHAIRAQYAEAAKVLNTLLQGDPENARAWDLLGDVELGRLAFADAYAAFEKTVALMPANFGALFKRALLALELGHYAVANQDAGALLKQFPKHTGAHYIRGVLRFRSEDFTGAIASLGRAEPAADEFPMLLYFLSAAQLVDGQHESAIANAAKFHQRAPQNIRGRLLYATALLRKADYRQVEALLRPVIDAEPNNTLALNLLANALMRSGESQEAISLLTEITRLEPESSVAQLRLGASLFLEGNNERAQQHISTALALEPEFQQAEVLLIVNHLESGAYEEAVSAATAHNEKEGESVASLNLLGRVYRAAGDLDQAVAVFEKALARYPDDAASHNSLAEIAVEQGDLERARSLYQRALEADPARLSTLLMLAQLDAKLQDHAALEKRLQTAIDTNPQALQPRLLLARYYLTQSRPEKVGPLFADLDPLQKALPQVTELSVRAQLGVGDYAAAKYGVSRLLEDNPDSATLHHMLAAADAGLGDAEGTRQALEKTLALNPENDDARLSLARLYLKANRTEAFENQLAKLTERAPENPALFTLRAESARLVGDTASALQWSERAYAAGRTSETVTTYAAAKAATQDWAGAVAVLEPWINENPDDVDARAALAGAYDKLGNSAAARTQYQRVLERDPDNVDALNVLAWHLRHSDAKKALGYARRAVEVAPRSAKALHTLALIEYVAGDYRRAARAAQRALDENPDDLSLKYHSAMIDAARGEKTLATSKLRALLRQGDDFPQIDQARTLLAQLTE